VRTQVGGITPSARTVKELESRTTTLSGLETGERLGITAETLANWRHRGFGPRFLKIGGRVRYRLTDIAEFLDAQTRNSTSDGGPDAG